MARYTIDFSTNASHVVREIEKVNAAVAQVARTGKKVEIELDASAFTASLNNTFRQLDRQIAQFERRLAKLPIGSRRFQETATAAGISGGIRERGGMQARAIRLGAEAGAFDEGSAVKLRKELEAVSISASQITPNTPEWINFQRQIGQIKVELQAADRLAESIQLSQNLGAFAPGSLNFLEAKLTILRNRAREIAPNMPQWKELNSEIVKTERNLNKLTRKPLTGGQRLGAAGGAFLYGGGLGGGAGSAVGGIAGGLMGGVPGAFTGAAVGQVVDNLGTALAGITSQASALMQMQRGLAMASIDAKDFAEAQATVGEMSQRLLMPLEQATRLFTQLRVNTKQYNLSVEDTAKIMEGTALAIMATGGSSEDLEGAMRAVVQIMSKGGVQAEELRGQLGERFPGAVVKFAQANKLSFEELQQGLEQGKIGIKEFVAFAEKNYDDYAEFSKQLATAPEYAGRRLAKAFEEMQLAIGQAFGPAGATIQDFTTQALKDITKFVVDNKDLLMQLGKDFAVVFAGIMSVVSEAGKFIIKVLSPVLSYIASVIRQLRVMTGAADAATAKAEMDAASAIIQRTGMGRDAYISGQRRSGSMADKIEFDKAQKRYERAQKRFKEAGGYAALPPETPTPSNLTFGGPGAGMSMERLGETAGRGTRGAKERESRIPELTEELSLTRQLFAIDQQITTAELGGNQLAVIRLNGIKEQLRIQSEIAKVRLQQDVPAAEKQLQIEKLRLDADKERLATNAAIQKQIQTELQGIQDAMVGIATAAQNELEDRQEYERLIKTGLAPAIAQITVEVRRQFATEVEKLKMLERQTAAEISILESKQNQTANDQEQLQILRDRLALIQGGIAEVPSLAGKTIESRTQKQLMEDRPKDATAFLTEAAGEAQKELAKLTNWGFQAVEGAKAIGSAFGQAFKDIASGSMSAQEALANMMQSIADHFLDMAAQIIAQQTVMIILGAIMKALGVSLPGSSGGGGGGSAAFGLNTPGMNKYAPLGGGPGTFPSLPVPGFADGGIVSGPTLGLVGEGKYNEAIVPLPDGRSIPVQFQGESIRDKMGSNYGSSPSTPILSMSFESTTINGVEYVSRDQLEAAMAETRRAAARDGATRGMSMTLDRLQQSPRTRSRIGLR